jgi:sigma-B regulation protein RsbU (phosphoserine phosphatase)
MTGGAILGCMEEFNYQSKKVQMAPGDLLYLYTDGVTEAFNRHEELFGDARLEAFLESHLQHPIDEVVKGTISEVTNYSKGVAQSDDITLMAIRFNGRNA